MALLSMSCPACEKRQAQEQRQLSDCESRCKEINAKNQKLTIALAVMTTLVGKESLDFALGLSSTLDQLSSNVVEAETPPVQVASAFPGSPSSRPRYMTTDDSVLTASLFGNLPPLTPSLSEVPASFSMSDEIWYEDTSMSFIPQTSGLLLGFFLLTWQNRKR